MWLKEKVQWDFSIQRETVSGTGEGHISCVSISLIKITLLFILLFTKDDHVVYVGRLFEVLDDVHQVVSQTVQCKEQLQTSLRIILLFPLLSGLHMMQRNSIYLQWVMKNKL